MDESELTKFILKLKGVKRFDLANQKLKRFLIHDVPFCVFGSADGRSVLHIRLSRAKIKMLKARYCGTVTDSNFYVSRQWAMMNLDGVIPANIICEAISDAYTKALNAFSVLSRAVYFEDNPMPYNLDYELIIRQSEAPPNIKYGKKSPKIADF
jgi:predicted DNA-binding protein (MmcQ/YjbR family)